MDHKEYKVIIPDEELESFEFIQSTLPGNGVVNMALAEFEPKIVFPWHVTVVVYCYFLDEAGMPNEKEKESLGRFLDQLNELVKGDPAQPNAQFLSKITWNETIELNYRAFDPEVLDNQLEELIESKSFPRDFDYHIDHDEKWSKAEWSLTKSEKGEGKLWI